jgi:anaerobic selenocysteine-containing dehydrogenase
MKKSDHAEIPVSCNKDCGGGCALLAHVEDGKVVRITNNPAINDPMATGCIRGFQMHRAVHSPDRLTAPLLRDGDRGSGRFKEISWERAIEYVAENLERIKQSSGTESIIRLGGSGACQGHVHNTGALASRFLSYLGKYTDQTGSYSVQATSFVRELMFGTLNVGIDPAVIEDSRLIILWGANIADTRFGNSLENWVLKKKNDGVPVIVIDPRRSRTVKRLATEWIPAYPGTDSALMASLLYIMLKEDLADRTSITALSNGFPELEQYILGNSDGIPKDPTWASTMCGVPLETISSLARRLIETKPAALIPGMSIQRTLGGEETTRLAVALQLAAGNVGRPGGTPGCNVWGRLPAPEFGSLQEPENAEVLYVPQYSWADAILNGKKGGYPSDINAIYNVGGNYLVQGSDIKKNIRAFEAVDFSVCHDLFLTPTARYCDIVLPVTSYLEREDVLSHVSNHLYYSGKTIEPVGESRDDYDIFCALADKLGFYTEFSQNRSAEEWLAYFIESSAIQDIDEFKKSGVFDGGEHNRIGLLPFVTDPDTHPLPTPSGKIEIASDHLVSAGLSRTPECRITIPGAEYPFRMVTPHSRYRINSTNGNIPYFLDKEEQVLSINSEDAEQRSILQYQVVEVVSEIGKIHVKADISGDIMRGVVCLPQGMWPQINDKDVETAGSPNMVTSTVPTEPSKGSRTHSVFVQVSPI